MRGINIAIGLCAALFVPALATAHPQQVSTPEPPQHTVDWMPTPAPAVTASGAAWQVDGDPVFFAGDWYDPNGATVFFDGSVMIRSSTYRGVPLYVDASVDTYTVVYLPIGGRQMRTYGRRLDQRAERAPSVRDEPGAASVDKAVTPQVAAAVVKPPSRPRAGDGVWIEFEGARWYSAGPAVKYTAARFTMIGRARGFPVYRDNTSTARRVYIPATANGLLAPYALN